MNGKESLILARRLQRESGMPVHAFRYRSVSETMPEVIARLNAFVRGLGAERLHLVGHSLGGLVIYRLLEKYPDLPPGRVVFLGTPAVSSRAAVLATRRIRWAVSLLGRCVAEELLTSHARRWSAERPLGLVAGTRPMGMGQFFARFDEDCDGTIAVSETRLPGATDHITLPVSHMGMLLSGRVARETWSFLQSGRFSIAT